MRCHVGRQAAEVTRWWSLHEDLHAATQVCAELAWKLYVATQVPAQLVGLAAACERQWGVGWCGPGSGPAVASIKGLFGWPGKGLAGWPGKGFAGWPSKVLVVARWCPQQGSW